MNTVALTARFPLGVYHGHAADGSPDQWPSPARLFSSLVSAAWTGTTAPRDGGLDESVTRALAWLEENPPTGLRLPPAQPVSAGSRQRIAYRDTGTLAKGAAKKAGKPISDGMAMGGEVSWVWEAMPPEIREVLNDLCADVPHLGEADTPVVLEVVTGVQPAWRLNPRATAFTSGGIRLPRAARGRAEALAKAHTSAYPDKTPTASADRYKKNEQVVAHTTPVDCLSTAHYEFVEPDRPGSLGLAWSDVLIFLADDGTGREFGPSRRVDWCVGFHKAIISKIGDGAPPMVTGRYPEGAKVPANRLAIHYVPASVLAQSTVDGAGDAPGAFLIMLPREMDDQERSVVLGALAGLRHVRSRWGIARLAPLEEIFHAESFWKAPMSGATRLWSPTPAAVPEVVRQRGDWTFESAILLSLAFVWRDALTPVRRGAQGYRDLVSQIRDHDASVMWYQHVTRCPTGYAHKMPQGMVAQPYRALIDTGDLLPDSALAAVGQSRHLGGGLLAPADLPAELVHEAARRNHAEH